MPDVSFNGLLIVAVIALGAPLLVSLAPQLRMPAVILEALLETPSAFARIPLFLAAQLLVRAVPAVLYASSIGRRQAVAAGLLEATSLPFIVTATQIGLMLGEITPVTAAALVSAGLLSVVAFPPIAVALLAESAHEPSAVPVASERA